MRRVVVTGLGLVTPLGADVETCWKNILASKSGAGPITKFDASDQKCRIACEVKPADHEYGFDPSKRVDHKVQRQVDPFIVYAIDAAGQGPLLLTVTRLQAHKGHADLIDAAANVWPSGDQARLNTVPALAAMRRTSVPSGCHSRTI